MKYADLLSEYMEEQRSMKRPKTADSSAQPGKPSIAQSRNEVLIDVFKAKRARGKRSWTNDGDHIKLLVSMDDTYNQLLNKACKKLGLEKSSVSLLSKNAIVDKESFRSVQEFVSASFMKPDKLSFGFAILHKSDVNSDDDDSSIIKSASYMTNNSLPGSSRQSSEGKSSLYPIVVGDEKVSQSSNSLNKCGLLCFNDQEIDRIMKSMERLPKDGAFGSIYVGEVRHTQVAVKLITQGRDNFKLCLKQLENEATLLVRYRHQNLVPIIGVCAGPKIPAVIYEYMSNGSLYDHIHLTQELFTTMSTFWKILIDAATGLAYLHSSEGSCKPVIHLDVKSSNILIDSNCTGKLGDFGFAKQVPTILDGRSYFSDITQCGTQGYMAPEILDGEMSTKLDVYSFGVVILESFTSQKAYRRDLSPSKLVDRMSDALKNTEMFKLQRASKYNVPVESDFENIRKVILNCLQPRCERANIEKILEDLIEIDFHFDGIAISS